jgi:hypothetical protein
MGVTPQVALPKMDNLVQASALGRKPGNATTSLTFPPQPDARIHRVENPSSATSLIIA